MKVISLGAGVQSSTMLLMADRGEFGTIDAAIFADTGWEPKAVYKHLDWLDSAVFIPIHRVSVGNIREDTLSGRLPRAGGANKRFATMPFHIRNLDGKPAMLRRQCTEEYKLKPLRRKVRELGATASQPVEMLIGISLDEAHRMKPSSLRYIRHVYPLVDARMTRHDCERWLTANGLPVPPKSACIGCPFHGDAFWRQLRDTDEWSEAVEFDRAIRDAPQRITGTVFLHRQLVPLDQVDLRTASDHGQGDLFGNDCDGMCGV